eukprot:CAMPEP_0204901610 /NCGR_PEP_ID=MMETSP1397-20131031/3176_1 /ASSEMBLY_ACC=CAM_ASM_000891 /TAXON_ID=49980 /ORGANISM="Climacostomum Climacostomum virens, Strain Stock W-24" /LENGTH=483 /DNA_ID=CAMNT_0052069989 /DNA_START=2028 /DNA_END=3479 /DNA_ORIENTATION=-
MDPNYKNRWLILILIFVMNVIPNIEQSLIVYFAANSPILADLDISDEEYSALSGTAYLLVSAVVLMPIGRWADKLKKTRWPLTISSVLLNLMSVASGFAIDFWTLLIPRLVCAVTSCAIFAISVRLIGQYFLPESRGKAIAMLTLSLYIGKAFSYLTFYFVDSFGWRGTYIGFGIFGTGVSLLVGLTLWREYIYTEEEAQVIENASNNYVLREFWALVKSNKTLTLTTIAFSLRSSAATVKAIYENIYFAREFPSKKVEYAFNNFGATIFTILGPFTGGYISDLKERTNLKWRPFLSCLASLVVVPLYAVLFTTSNFELAMVLIYLTNFFTGFLIAVAGALMLNISPTHMRAFVNGVLQTITRLFTASVIAITGSTQNSFEDLRISMLCWEVVGVAVSGLIFLVTIATYPHDYYVVTRANSEISHELLSNDQSMESFKDLSKSKEIWDRTYELKKAEKAQELEVQDSSINSSKENKMASTSKE